MHYIGRYAPSPTGPLHFGSLVAAVASYCDAKANQGKWLLRIEDIDKPREVKGAADTILQQLEAFGFEWDGDILYQSQRSEYYADTLNQLQKQQMIYPCTCTRKEIADSSHQLGIEGLVYPNTCLHRAIKPNTAAAFRVKTHSEVISFNDAIQGNIAQTLNIDIGDFVLKRADGFFTYQLTVVVDDAAQGVTHIVRGADLLNSTPRQHYLQQLLGLTCPTYAHVPVATNQAGEKLSKQTKAPTIDMQLIGQNLFDALSFLGQQPPVEIKTNQPAEIWSWAIENWQLANVPRQNCVFYNSQENI
ncbi:MULTISPECIES: tRNA glutamyl-Q(34) synthetase GluQRS [Methylotenera]|uniref:tRNA glutamyl-Q(34) synthetase GluQRS n=1 Tax=Methylotenera TaxID=359407 RepID=UPI0003661AA8|nr:MULTISPECIES: tRNA glutamyl-Q(34) synthetase GluQRS [Methylotenera]